jgi:hypothetical protein
MQPQVTPPETKSNYDGNQNDQEQGSAITFDNIMARLQDLLHEGNVRRVIVKSPQGQMVLDVPLTVLIIVTLVAPWLVAIGAVLAIVTRYSIDMERRD